jgi:hypothetical protein
MDLLSSYRQVKKEKTSGLESIVEMNLFEDGNVICYFGEFSFDYRRYGTRKRVTIYHTLNLNIKNGDFTTFYQLINKGEETEKLFKSRTKRGKNNFYELYNNWIDSGYKKSDKPSVDRIDDYKGYSFDNIQLMTWKENNKKNTLFSLKLF